MILKRLLIHRLPGIGQPFEIEAEGSGIHVIFGPNGIGKSSICRALEGLYWEDRGSFRHTSVTGEFDWDGTIWRAEREGTIVRWRRDGEGRIPPVLPPSRHHNCFFLRLRDLLDPSHESTSGIASEIRRQMSGGFDLDGIASELFTPVTIHRMRKEKNNFNKARDEVQKEVNLQSNLQRRVDQLEELKSQLRKAETAARRLPQVDRASGLAERREESTRIEERLGIMPNALANLTGKEHDDLGGLRKQLTQQEASDHEFERKLQEARARGEESGLSCPLEQAELATWRDKADELERVELELKQARTKCASARGELDAALKAVGGKDVDKAALTLPNHAELFEYLRAAQEQASRVHSINERLRLLKRVKSSGLNPQQELEKRRSGVDALRAWLRARLPSVGGTRWTWVLAGISLLAVGAVLGWWVDPRLALLAALGAGIAVAATFMGKLSASDGNGASSENRSGARKSFENLGLEGPEAWDISSVSSRLREMESETAELQASMQRARDRDVERESLKNELEGLSERESDLATRRQELKERLGLDALPPDAELVDFARALDHLRGAQGGHEAANGKVKQLETSHGKLLADLAGILKRHGEPQPEDAAAAKARLNNLAKRNGMLEKALGEEQSIATQKEQNFVQRETTRVAIERIYAEAGLEEGDEQGLVSLLERLPEYRKLIGEKRDLESKNDLDRKELKRGGEAELTELETHSIEKLKRKLETTSSQNSRLRDEIAEVRNKRDEARGGNKLQDLIAEREEARANLRSLRDDALFVEAGNFLLKEVEEEHEQAQLPRVLKRSGDHFSRFTLHNYELRLEKSDAQPRLSAVELRSGKVRQLDELSAGTRAQLLLAARIAYTEEVEQGKVMPLFLDEALDQSDPQRFQAITANLGCVARDQGRQIFYLTSDPLDVDRIRDALATEGCDIAAEIDLGRIRTGQVSVKGPQDLRIDPEKPVPEPDGLSPEEYAALLKVPTFRPILGFAEQHVFYILWDDLPLLRDFLDNRIERGGQWKTVSGTPLAEKLGSRSIDADQIGLRLDLLEAFCGLWQEGRGRPVDRDVLIESGAVSKVFLEKVITIAKELSGDPQRLVAMLRDRGDDRLRGFRTKSIDQLQEYLTENGILDHRPILTKAELLRRALTTPAANQLPEGVAKACLQRWWGWGRHNRP